MSSETTTVYVNDAPIYDAEVYHARQAHAVDSRLHTDRRVRETTVEDARDDGLRPCQQCFPDGSGQCCPACGYPGNGDSVLANDQLWCSNTDCAVVSFDGGDSS